MEILFYLYLSGSFPYNSAGQEHARPTDERLAFQRRGLGLRTIYLLTDVLALRLALLHQRVELNISIFATTHFSAPATQQAHTCTEGACVGYAITVVC